MLNISGLRAQTSAGIEILKGLDLEVKPGEIHAIMGPNGSGKSTLSKVIAGHPDYSVTQGSINFEVDFKIKNIADWPAEDRAGAGIFLAFQYPIEIPGVPNAEFLRIAFNAICKRNGANELDSLDFQDLLQTKVSELKLEQKFVDRFVNVDFSGGEKKRNEILQMAILKPRLTILDEIDSGLDVDALRAVASNVNDLHSNENAIILITHYQRILDYISPDFVHVLYNGKIIKSGTKELAKQIEAQGYDQIIKELH